MNVFDREEMEKWCSQWNEASKTEEFKDKSPKKPNPDLDFFGYPTEKNQSKESIIESADIAYWNEMAGLSMMYGEQKAYEEYVKSIDEAALDIAGLKSLNKKIADAPNPVVASSIGKDQDISDPVVAGNTYSPEDLVNLDALKVKLHDLLSKLSAMESTGKTDTKLENQIESLNKQIDELSDSLSISTPLQK